MIKVFKSTKDFNRRTGRVKQWTTKPIRLKDLLYELRLISKNRNGADRSYLRIMDQHGVIRGAVIDIGIVIDNKGPNGEEQVYRPFIQVDGDCELPTNNELILRKIATRGYR